MQIIYCISFIDFFFWQDAAACDGPDPQPVTVVTKLLPSRDSAQVPALPMGTLRVDQTTTRKHLNTKGMQTETKATWQVGQIPPAIWKQHTAPLQPCYSSR